MTAVHALPISVAIPTYRRDQVLVDTVRHLVAMQRPPREILVIDQSERHEESTAAQLAQWHNEGTIRWLRLARPSIPAAMNAGLLAATQPVVLFLDDDIVPEPDLLAAHCAAHQERSGIIVAGRVLQPWDEGPDLREPGKPFAGTQPQWVAEFMGGNFSVPRDIAITTGGFDENFVRVAYRFEAEFAHRWLARGGRIRYEPRAGIRHLKVEAGGTRSYGDHRSTWRPDHAVGAYYFALRTQTWREFLARPWQSVATRYHLRRPWRVPVTLVAELRGMAWAWRLHRAGPSHLRGPAQ